MGPPLPAVMPDTLKFFPHWCIYELKIIKKKKNLFQFVKTVT